MADEIHYATVAPDQTVETLPTPSTGNALPGTANPVEDLLDGVVLLIRRTFFNTAPTVSPVEISGKTEGLITGTIGAVDPEGDTIEYQLVGEPSGGTVVLHADGTYSYSPGTDFDGADTFSVTATDTGFHINLLDLFRAPSTDAAVAVFQNPAGTPQVVFRFTFFDSEWWTPAAREAMQSAARDLASHIVVSSPVIMTYTVNGYSAPGSGVLADASEGFYPGLVRQKILTGVDENAEYADGQINWNFGYSWAYGDAVSGAKHDFETVATHELLHTLGFVSLSGSSGSGLGSLFDSFVVSSDGSPLTYANFIGANGGLYFGGAHAVAAYGGLVPLFTPSVYSTGVSVSHLGILGDVMSAGTPAGDVYKLSPVDLGILEDLGYTVTVPQDVALFV